MPVDYLMLRGIFMPPGVSPDQVAYYLGLFTKLRALPEWKDFMDKGAFKQSNLSGAAFEYWSAAMSTPPSTTRSRPSRTGAPASCARCA